MPKQKLLVSNFVNEIQVNSFHNRKKNRVKSICSLHLKYAETKAMASGDYAVRFQTDIEIGTFQSPSG